MIHFKVLRKRASYDYKADKNSPDGFDNNWKNNSMDTLVLCEDGVPIYECRCQTVANYCFGDMATADTVAHGDTVAEGEFMVRLFVEPRSFHGRIHAITRTRDLDGQWIDHNAMQTTKGGFQNGRWLIHDRYSLKTGTDTRYAWSAGCFILSSDDLHWLNDTIDKLGGKPGDLVKGTVEEV